MKLKISSRRKTEPRLKWGGYLNRYRRLRRTVRGESSVEQGRGGVLSDRGASLLEFALACPIFLLMLTGIVEIAWALYTYNYVSHAAREATRYAVVRGSTSCTNTANLPNCNATAAEIKAYVQANAYGGIQSNSMTVRATWLAASPVTPPETWTACTSGTCNAPGNLVQETVTYPFSLAIPFWGAPLINISSTSQMVISQ
jgi:Flp pilus assembly protein TadG